MNKRSLVIGVAILSLATSATAAENLTERQASDRMTVLTVDRAASRFQCVEHKRWTTVVKGSLKAVGVGDVVKVTRHDPQPASVRLVRTAADELASPE